MMCPRRWPIRPVYVVLCAFIGLVCHSARAQKSTEAEAQAALSIALDARLNACFMVSLDEGWAVGDRGLILRTQDSGKNWLAVPSGQTCPLNAIQWSSKGRGIIVGGSIQPYSLRSTGCVLTSADGGKTWKHCEQPDLPRLTGVQSLGQGHYLAWGDFSSLYRTSVFESFDHGQRWSPVPSNLGHLQSAAWQDRANGIAIDRLSRVVRIDDRLEPRVLPIGGDWSRPLRKVRFAQSGWWMVGACGQIYRSLDGERWERLKLPGNENDQELFDLVDVYCAGSKVWVVGSPGQVVWCSEDLGQSWRVQNTSQSLPLVGIHGFSDERLMAIGPMARILGSRNSGNAWWTEHQKGTRIGLINIADQPSSAAWEALIVATWNSGKHAGLISLKDGRIESRVDLLPDWTSREDVLRSRMGLSWNEALNSLEPRRLIARLRALRPDVVVCSGTTGDSPEDRVTDNRAAQRLVLQAMENCADKNFAVYSRESGILDQAWEIKKVFEESKATPRSIALDQDLVLAKPGRLMSDFLETVASVGFPSRVHQASNARSQPLNLTMIKSPNFTDISRRELFGGLAHDDQSSRQAVLRSDQSFQRLSSRLQRDLACAKLTAMPGNRWEKDRAWEKSLDHLIESDPMEQRIELLMKMAVMSRSQGYWNRWQACLGRIIRLEPKHGAAEEAWRQLEGFAHSQEVLRGVRKQWAATDSSADESPIGNAAVSVSNIAPISPFPSQKPMPDSGVRLAAFQAMQSDDRSNSNPEMIDGQPVRSADYDKVIGSARNENDPWHATSDESSHLAKLQVTSNDQRSIVDPRALKWVENHMQQHNPLMAIDPRMQLIAAAHRPMPRRTSEKTPAAIWSELAQSQKLAGWSQLGQQELEWDQRRLQQKAMLASLTDQRPILDGKLDDPCWQLATMTSVTRPQVEEDANPTSVRFLYDSEFLFIAIQVTLHAERSSHPDDESVRSYDELDPMADHVELRFDVDRDYASWYTFRVDRRGSTSEDCGEDRTWNPEWYVATSESKPGWSVELAIPLSELIEGEISADEAWASMVIRKSQGAILQHNGRVLTTDFLPQGMRLLHFQ